ncbi:MarR family transcriptional regulator [Mycolicibacterium neoaurum]|uniref:MarR family transcriptional regulator n=1 Tax=Mycolicibacterium neoaurum TaxID=1795 RepID=UPI002673D0A8|nr:MarR family transcriptional regulator [Mycolicibacterium neoaurum]MDO3402732.1 MarR family transcriptional regulator [Mycolicibacterium neoaurum]
MSELAILQATRLKRRLSPELAATSTGLDDATLATLLDSLRESELVKGETAVRLTPEGRERLNQLLATERGTVDQAALRALYEEFDNHNTALKTVVKDWQLRDDEPNDHSDATYDRTVLDRLVQLDDGFEPLVARIAEVAPRLSIYSRRFATAIAKIGAGDNTYVASPVADSYHTVWFEFHEELIGLLGLTREEEAAAGRAV